MCSRPNPGSSKPRRRTRAAGSNVPIFKAEASPALERRIFFLPSAAAEDIESA
jgi:hypothetical protein